MMLKVLDPLFKKKHASYVMPVKITGTYEHPLFGLDLTDREDNKPHMQNADTSRFPSKARH
jgi:hypothetical protein